jgi:hypothetical protein
VRSSLGRPFSRRLASDTPLDVHARMIYSACMTRMHKAPTTQYTIRNVPRVVDRALRRRAERLSKSLNEVAVDALARGAGVEQEAKEQHDLDFLFGTWVDDPAVDAALGDQRSIDKDLWK